MTKSTDNQTIRELAEILNDTNLTEIEIEREGMRIKVARKAEGITYATQAPMPAQVAPAPSAPVAAPALAASLGNNPGALKSPMVGTIYLAPEPGAKNFISEGDTVKAGQTLFIIEAMKTMNPVVAASAGIVKSILASNAQPVEFDEVLAIIE
jgi:acetyl-CoA carboxylase biotin carboxyl carrier protein